MQVDMDKDMAEAIGSYNPVLAGIAAAQTMAQVRGQVTIRGSSLWLRLAGTRDRRIGGLMSG